MKSAFAPGTLVEVLCELQANIEIYYRFGDEAFNFMLSPGTLLVYGEETGPFIDWKGPEVIFCSIPEATHRKYASAWFGDRPFLHQPGLYKFVRISCTEPQNCFRAIET